MKMKQIIFILMVLIYSTSAVFAQDDTEPKKSENFFIADNTAWKTELQSAKNQNKVILVQLLTDDCETCEELKNKIWKNEEVGRFYNSNFLIWAPVPGSKDEKNFKKKYHVKSYPTTLFIAPDGSLVPKYVGLPPH
jgi:thiol:disulfide interchange protein